MLVNWKIKYCDSIPSDKQPPDYYIKGQDYWFYRFFSEKPEVDVLDMSSFPALENFEKKAIHICIYQALKAIPKLSNYDLVVSHGMPSAVIIALWQRIFKKKVKHIVFDIGCFNSAAEDGTIMKMMQFVSKSIDGIIYHTKCQKEYYEKYYPWLSNKSKFIRFGADLDFFKNDELKKSDDFGSYIICVGAGWRDWDTLVKAYQMIDTDLKLRIVGKVNSEYENINGIEQISYIPVKEMINQIYNAKLCVLPLVSRNFSYGQMTFLQQMALGKCVISAKVPSLEGYAENMKTAVFYEPKDIQSCANAIKTVLNDSALENSIITNAKEYLQKECNEKVMAQEIEAFYNKIIKKDYINENNI